MGKAGNRSRTVSRLCARRGDVTCRPDSSTLTAERLSERALVSKGNWLIQLNALEANRDLYGRKVELRAPSVGS